MEEVFNYSNKIISEVKKDNRSLWNSFLLNRLMKNAIEPLPHSLKKGTVGY